MKTETYEEMLLSREYMVIDRKRLWSSIKTNIFGFNSYPVNSSDICNFLIWNDGVAYPHQKANMTQKMNEIAMDMLLKGAY